MGGDNKDKDSSRRRKQARAISILQWFAGQEVNPERVMDRKHRDRDKESERRRSSRRHYGSSDRPSTASPSTVTGTTASEWSSTTTTTKKPTRSASHRDTSTTTQGGSEDGYGPPSPHSSTKQTRIMSWAADVNPGAPAPPSVVGRSGESVAANGRVSKPASSASTVFPSDSAASLYAYPVTTTKHHGGSSSQLSKTATQAASSSSRQRSRCPTTTAPSNYSSRHGKSHSSIPHSQAPEFVSVKSHPTAATRRDSARNRPSSERQAPSSSGRSSHSTAPVGHSSPGYSLRGGDGGSRAPSRKSRHSEGNDGKFP